MGKKTVYEQIKKQNGEHFAQTISNYHNGIFDIPDIVDIVKYAGNDAEPILKYLFSLKEIKIEPQSVHKDPITLLAEAGYDAYYADTLEKQNAPKKYFAPGEELCTFRDPNRFKKYHIIWCIKKDVDKIKRKNFRGIEKRQDEYGTSVICIQILKAGGMISIKNRYNHTVSYCDDTFDSNPDKIIGGLSDSLRHHLHTDFSSRDENIPDDFILMRNQLIRFNREIDNVYFGDNFFFLYSSIHSMSNTELLMDNFVFDIKKKTVKNLLDDNDCFPDVFMKEIKDKKVQIKKDKEGNYHLFADNVELVTVKNGQITTLNLPTTKKIGNNFLHSNQELSILDTPSLKKIGWSLPRKLWDFLTDIDVDTGFFYMFGNYLKDFDPHFLKSNHIYKTNAPALIKKLPSERILKKDFSLENRLACSANNPVPMREMLKDQANQPEPQKEVKSKQHPKKSVSKGFWGKLWQRIKPHD